MSSVIDSIERAQLRTVPRFQAGDRLKVHFQVVEGTRRRTQVFEGVVLKRQGSGARETFTVRKQSFGVGVERTFPLHSPKIERIEVASRGDVRRAKLYYLRGRVGRRARVRERQYTGPEADAAAREVALASDDQGTQAEAPAEANPDATVPADGTTADGEAPQAPADDAPDAAPAGEAAADSSDDATSVPPDSEAKEPREEPAPEGDAADQALAEDGSASEDSSEESAGA
jgi:large subunit ribosomal protein L19